MQLKNDKIEVIKIEDKIKADYEKYLKDPVFMALVKNMLKKVKNLIKINQQ